MHDWHGLARQVLAGTPATRAQALAVLQADDAETLEILAAAYRIRRTYWSNEVHLHLLMNAQSGLCPEDCHYCSQSSVSSAPIEKYPMRERQTILDGARRAKELGVSTYCIVMSGRGPNDKAVDAMCDTVREIKQETGLKICGCFGLLREDQAQRLKAAGVDRYNHNLNTSKAHSPQIVKTHTYDDRVRTVENVKNAGISPCSGLIAGMGESDEDLVDVAFALAELGVDSIPVNFLHPIEGTPLAGDNGLTPNRCLRILSMVRFVNPDKEIRVAGGREVNLRSMQPLGLYAANSIFLGDYLTTKGQVPDEDYKMIEDLGFKVNPKPISVHEKPLVADA
jgi:biotin synthase